MPVISGRDKDNNAVDARLSSTDVHALAIMEEIQALREAGNVFQASIELSIGTGVTDYVLGITPSTGKKIMMTQRTVKAFAASGAIEVTVELLRDVTCTTDTGDVTPVNANHNSDNTAEFLINKTTAAVSGGDAMPGKMYLIASTYIEEAGGSSAGAYEMKLDSKYALKIINSGAATVTVVVSWEWAEVE